MNKIEMLLNSIQADEIKLLEIEQYISAITNAKLLSFVELIALSIQEDILKKQELLSYEENRLAVLEG